LKLAVSRSRPSVPYGANLYVVVYFVLDACLLLLCLFQFFSTKSRDWLGRTSPKWLILCRVGRKTTTQSINSFILCCWP